MKNISVGLLVLVGLVTCGCATSKRSVSIRDSSSYIELIRISAEVDGSERFVFTKDAVRIEHKFWSRPTGVVINGEPWADLEHGPSWWRDLDRDLDLSRAWIVKRDGRDVIALEHTANGFDLYLCDSPNGAAHYELTIAVPRRVSNSGLSQRPLHPIKRAAIAGY